jgi:hypothetical protein
MKRVITSEPPPPSLPTFTFFPQTRAALREAARANDASYLERLRDSPRVFPEKTRPLIALTPGTRGAGRQRPVREEGTFDAMRGVFGTDVRSNLRVVK